MKIYLVGGAVRDELLGLKPKERDWVVVGAMPEDLLRLGYKQVGKEFPVFLHPETGEEYALARTERKVAPGYKGFVFNASKDVTLEEDLERRDLTINAMARTPEGELIDPYHGQEDLKHRVLRHVSLAFSEDPVRILRIARFAARFANLNFTVASETIGLMRSMVAAGEVDALVAERVWKELERALGEAQPPVFFEVLESCGALEKLFPMVDSRGEEMKMLQRAAEVTSDTVVRFAVLTHRYSKEALSTLCKRYRLPTDYKELALLVRQSIEDALNFDNLNADQILDLYMRTDAFRREERFENFLVACRIIAGHQGRLLSDDLKQILESLKQIEVKPLVEQGLAGPEIAAHIKRARLFKIIMLKSTRL